MEGRERERGGWEEGREGKVTKKEMEEDLVYYYIVKVSHLGPIVYHTCIHTHLFTTLNMYIYVHEYKYYYSPCVYIYMCI